MTNSFSGPLADPAGDAGWLDGDSKPRKGFFTDTSICIGCKACEVACKEWNGVPDDGLTLLGYSYDNIGELSVDTWRHVAFVEQRVPARPVTDLGMPGVGPPDQPGRCSSSSGRATATTRMLASLARATTCSSRSSRAGWAQWRSSITTTSGCRSASTSRNRRTAHRASSEVTGAGDSPISRPSRSDPRPSGPSGR